MNQKNLNYEIETCRKGYHRIVVQPMNQKNLNYEIEKLDECVPIGEVRTFSYESKESQL